ncbi:MAG: tetratricopeptide repeat protein [Promethearchaeota archaeon]
MSWKELEDKGIECRNNKEYEKSLKFLEDALQINPNSTHVLIEIGRTYSEMGNFKVAIETFEEVLDINPNVSMAYNNIGWIYYKKEEYDKAVKYYEDALKVQSYNSIAANNICVIANDYRAKKQYDKALELYKLTLGYAPKDITALINLGIVHGELGDFDIDIDFQKKALEVNPNLVNARINIGFCYYKLEKYNDAINWLMSALLIDKNLEIAWNNLKFVYEALGDNIKKQKAIDKTLIPNPKVIGTFDKQYIDSTIKLVEDLLKVTEMIHFEKLSSKVGINVNLLELLIEELIMNGDLNVKIKDDCIVKSFETIGVIPHGIGHDVFICHSSKDKKVADATCHFLEQHGVKCWIAPRDVSTGSYAESIVNAIENSKLLVIIFSSNSNISNHVKNELEIAVSSGITIQPFRIENIEPSTEMKYYIKRMHWLDALTPPLEDHLTNLVKKISQLLEAIST